MSTIPVVNYVITPEELEAALAASPGDDEPCPCKCGKTRREMRLAALAAEAPPDLHGPDGQRWPPEA